MGRKPNRRAKPNKKAAVAYLRVSTSRQRQELGEAGQRAAIEGWAKREGVRVVAWHVEEVSGGAKLDDRPKLTEAVADVIEQRAGLLVFSTLDRFSRDPLTAALIEAELSKAGAEIVFADGSGNGDDPTAEMVRGIRLAVARFERRMIGARIRAALAVKQRRGEMTGAPRFGFRAVPGPARKDRNGNERQVPMLESAPGEQKIIAEVRRLSNADRSVREIVAELAAKGVTGRKGTPLTRTAVHNLLRRED
jgi:DNA invertase Pin-like site-specific DNA recombinase